MKGTDQTRKKISSKSFTSVKKFKIYYDVIGVEKQDILH